MTDRSIAMARQLCGWLAGTGIELLELSGPGTTIRLRRTGSGYAQQPASSPAQAAPARGGGSVVRSGSVGVLLHAHPLRQAPLVRPGDPVRAGQPLAVLQIGAVLLAVPAPRDGTVARMLVADGTTVGYGDPLVELE